MSLAFSDVRAFDELVGAFYDCVLNPELWEETLTRLHTSLNFISCVADIHDCETHDVRYATILGIPQDQYAQDIETMVAEAKDAHRTALTIFTTWPIEEPWVFHANNHRERFGAFKTTQAMYEVFGLIDGVTFITVRDGKYLGHVHMGRHRDYGYVTADEAAFIKRLMPHVQRAMTISNVLNMMKVELHASRKTLDALAVGVIVVTASGEVIETNVAADAILEAEALLRVRQGKLEAINPDANLRLMRAFAAATADAQAAISGAGVALPGLGDSGVAYVLPYAGRPNGRAFISGAKAVLFVKTRSTPHAVPLDALSALYGLTRAETALLGLIADGRTVEDCAKSLGVAITTARTHLARLFAKTGTSRQPELVALVGRLVPPLDDSNGGLTNGIRRVEARTSLQV
jgi:DNA-binding CsgD family transcriptional regulator/PAS domain-containing protein